MTFEECITQIAPPSSGRVAVRFRRVVCRPPQDVKLQVLNATGSGGWLRLLTTVRLQRSSAA